MFQIWINTSWKEAGNTPELTNHKTRKLFIQKINRFTSCGLKRPVHEAFLWMRIWEHALSVQFHFFTFILSHPRQNREESRRKDRWRVIMLFQTTFSKFNNYYECLLWSQMHWEAAWNINEIFLFETWMNVKCSDEGTEDMWNAHFHSCIKYLKLKYWHHSNTNTKEIFQNRFCLTSTDGHKNTETFF